MTDDSLVQLWAQLAAHYSGDDRVMFGIMNEPHDIPDLKRWAVTVQKVVTAIRQAGATSQYILLPGDNWTHASDFPNWFQALKDIKNPDGSNDNLIFDVHQYLDNDNSGTHDACVNNNLDVFTKVTSILAQNGNRKAIVTETGGANNNNCAGLLRAQLDLLKSMNNHIVGFAIWSAGGIDPHATLSVTPVQGNDQLLWAQVVKNYL